MDNVYIALYTQINLTL